MITNVVMKKNPTSVWADDGSGIIAYQGGEGITSGAVINNGDSLLFTLDFKLPVGALNESNTVVYDLSAKGIPVRDNAIVSIYRTEKPYDKIGTCYVDKAGKVSLVFDDSIVEGNRTEKVVGGFYFVSQAYADQSEEGVPITYDFGDNFTIKVVVKNKKDYDLSLSKTGVLSEDNDGNNIITYTIYLSSSENGLGSGGDISLSDIMSISNQDATVAASFNPNDITITSIKKYDSPQDTFGIAIGNDVTGTQTGFDRSLDQLEPGERYEIVYTYKVPQKVIDATYDTVINNYVSALTEKLSKKEANFPITIDGTDTKSIPSIKKLYKEADTENNTVTWSIIINENNADLKGYTLKDMIRKDLGTGNNQFVEEYLNVEADINPALNGKNKINLSEDGLIFSKSDTNTYTITYTSTYDEASLLWGGSVSNRAFIEDDEHKNDTGYINVWVENVDKDKLDKTNSGYELNDGKAVITWNITLKGPIICNISDSNNRKCWEFADEIGSNSLLTDQQIDELKTNLNALGIDYSFETVGERKTLSDGTEGYAGYKVTFYSDISKGSNPTFSYHTTGFIGDGKNRIEYYNQAYVYNKNFSHSSTVTYEPMLSKFDGNLNHNTTTYKYYSDTLFNEGILTWIVKVKLPDTSDLGELTLIDTLPDTVSILDSLDEYNSLVEKGINAVDVSTDALNYELLADNGSALSGNIERNGSSFDINTEALKGQELYIRIRAKIKDDYWKDGEVTSGSFTNSVKLQKKDDDSSSYGEDSQTQVVNRTDTVIDKKAVLLTEDQELCYTVDINPNADNLVPDSNILTMKDSLTATYYHAAITADLLLNTIKIYDADTNQNLSEGEYKYSLSSYSEHDGAGYHVFSDIEFTIPDERHIRIEYTYVFGCDDEQKYNWDNISVLNTAKLEGVSSQTISSETNHSFKFSKVGAHAGLAGFELYKVDSENTAIKLPGAKFSLYKYNATSKEYVLVESFDTGDKTETNPEKIGHHSFDEIDKNTAYKLVEDEAPDGYRKRTEPIYFMIENPLVASYVLPGTLEEFKAGGGILIEAGSDYFVKNTKENASVTVEKVWVNADDTKPDYINVKIGRRLGPEASENIGDFWVVHFVNKTAQKNITRYVGYPSVKDGSVLTVTVDGYNDGSWNALPQVMVNGNQQDPSSELSNVGWQRITYTIDIHRDTTVEVTQPNQQYDYNPEVSLSQPSTSTVEGLEDDRQEDNFIETTVTAAEGWSKTIESYKKDGETVPLPRYEEINGKKYQWIYYVSEYSNHYYEAEYKNNNVNSGTITIINTRNDVEGYVLPKTGGIGDIPVKGVGAGIMIVSLFGGIAFLGRRKKKKDTA